MAHGGYGPSARGRKAGVADAGSESSEWGEGGVLESAAGSGSCGMKVTEWSGDDEGHGTLDCLGSWGRGIGGGRTRRGLDAGHDEGSGGVGNARRRMHVTSRMNRFQSVGLGLIKIERPHRRGTWSTLQATWTTCGVIMAISG